MDNSGAGPLRVPGFGLPISYEPRYDIDRRAFAIGHVSHMHHGPKLERMTKREIEMVRFMEAITDKPDWNPKVYDDTIIAKWHREAQALPGQMISEAAFRWCIDELRDRAKSFEANGWISALELPARVVKADNLVTSTLQAELREAARPLLDSKEKDWHPGSDSQVLNLVHPSLFPLVYGKTSVLVDGGSVGLDDCLQYYGQGSIGESNQEVAYLFVPFFSRYPVLFPTMWSKRFQWLPAEVKFVNETQTGVKITSYIYNLFPPEHKTLYAIVEKLISLAIPLWNHVLIRGFDGRIPLRIKATRAKATPDPPEWAYGEPDTPEVRQAAYEYLALPDNPSYRKEREEEWEQVKASRGMAKDWQPSGAANIGDLCEAVRFKYYRIRKVLHPEPGNYAEWKQDEKLWRPLASSGITLEDEYRDRGLQVIVKLSSIELTPDNPKYNSGNWHYEGMLNEHIIGTAIYYYDVSNVTESRLRFRQEESMLDLDLHYEQEDHAPIAEIFGVDHELPLHDVPGVQEIGNVATKHGRMLAFPNVLQHKVKPFELIDKTKPGHRRFIVLWLVDPDYRIVSTANVPPQQKEWYLKAQSLNLNVREAVDRLMDLEEAEQLRRELMEERTAEDARMDDSFTEYSLCEH